jgi:hypothetical protein
VSVDNKQSLLVKLLIGKPTDVGGGHEEENASLELTQLL